MEMVMDVAAIKQDFPILRREIKPGVPLVYLDSASSSQMPRQVLDAMEAFHLRYRSNIHRAVHTLAEEGTQAYNDAREDVAKFIHAGSEREVIFTRNTTESINLVANSWGRKYLKEGDVVLLTEMEHHANLVPWQMLAAQIGFELEFIPVTDAKELDMGAFYRLLERKPKLVGVMHVSNVLGTVNPIEEIIHSAKAIGAVTLIDGAQAVPHMPVDVAVLGADFYAFSGHKMLGPTGIGVLYGREEMLEAMPPFLGGGDMIKKVELRSFKANDLPYKFEAGTPAIAEAIGLGAAARYLEAIGMDAVEAHDRSLTDYALERLELVKGVDLFGPGIGKQLGAVSFTIPHVHPHDVSHILNGFGVAVRAGHHCAMPLHTKFNLLASSRASFSIYNDRQEIDVLVEGIKAVINLLG